jgi:ABC-type proline/glycine betaine transport system permease subunit
LATRAHGQALDGVARQPAAFPLGLRLAIVVGIPIGLVTGRFRAVEAAIGIYITAGYAMPLVALVPLLVLWLGLGFAVKVAVVFLMSVFPICINTWHGVTAVPKTLIEVGKSFVAPNTVILRRIILPATLPYIMAGIRLAVGRAVVAMVIAEFFTSISGLGAIIITSANNFDTATVRAHRCPDGHGYRTQLPDRRGRALGRALAGGDCGAGGITDALRRTLPASLQPREKIGEVDELFVLHGVDDLGHLGIVAAS